MKIKNIYLLLFTFITLASVFQSCEEDLLVDRLTEPGAIPVISDVTSGFFNFNDPATAQIGFSLATKGTDVTSVSILKSINGSEPVAHATISTLPATVNVTLADALSGTGVALGDVAVGDVVSLIFVCNTADGRALKSGATFDAPVSCPSALAGTYSSVASGTSTDGCCPDPITGFASTVTLTDLGDGNYEVSDFSGGLYLEWYDVYGITSTNDSPCNIQDVCGTLTIVNTTEPFGTVVTGGGSVDSATGVITITWENGYADQGTIVLTPQ